MIRAEKRPSPFDVLQMVQAEPGIRLTEIRERTQLGWASIYQRLDYLQSRGLLRRHKDGHAVHLFPTEASFAAEPEIAADAAAQRLRGDTARRIAKAVVEHPGIGSERLAQILGVHRRVVYYHVRILVETGLVQRAGGLCRSKLIPTPALIQAVEADGSTRHVLNRSHRATNLEIGQAN